MAEWLIARVQEPQTWAMTLMFLVGIVAVYVKAVAQARADDDEAYPVLRCLVCGRTLNDGEFVCYCRMTTATESKPWPPAHEPRRVEPDPAPPRPKRKVDLDG